MNPESFRAWQGVIRDLVIVVVGAFMLIYETVAIVTPNPYLIGAGLVALGVPPALRADEKLRRGKNEERWSHLP